jgi:hypothetical protein
LPSPQIVGADGDVGPHAVVVLVQVQGSQPLDRLQPVLDRLLVDAFREEVLLLSRLMGRDLSHWV